MVVGKPELGIIQEPNVSAKAEEDMANPIAQNTDTNLAEVLAFILLNVNPFCC
jgi:hypothetical protein